MTQAFKRLVESRKRLSTQLYLGIGGAVVTTMAASIVGWFSLNSVGTAQSHVNDESLPGVVAAFGVAQHGGTLVDAAPRLTTALTPNDLARVSASIDEARASLEAHLTVLLGVDAGASQQSIISQGLSGLGGSRDLEEDQGPGRSERIRAQVDTLTVNIEAIEGDMSKLFTLTLQAEALREELAALRVQVDDVMTPIVDDQLFYTMTGYQDLDAAAAARDIHFSEEEFAHYRHLAGLHADATTANQLLESAFSISSAPLLEPLRERFESASGSIERNLSALAGTPLRDAIKPVMDRLDELGVGEDNGFALLEERLNLIQHQQNLLAVNRGIAVDLVSEVNALVTSARASAEDAALASNQAILTGRTLLLAISAISIGGALLIAWLFVGRVILSRLQMLSGWMRRMAGGDLEATAEIGGSDEVADMAAALEVFRRHALEVQRLNLVEQLAQELQGKNEQLESVLAELRLAQDQIVMREKLAALGELTAGVAHEIKNPLNFVKNFSESSGELLVELEEVLEESAESLSEDQKDYIEEISGDLKSNLERISSHGERANRIVHDMLMMGRESGDYRPTDVNALLEEHGRLAYHSARATDSEFQLDLKHDLDPDVGEIEVITQDIGRAFLNIIANACYATDEKRRGLLEAGDNSYMPTVWLTTRRKDENIEVRIRDNGNGIPPEVAEKIFNPFFTTKPTDRGTGLGLALTNDIVREHGGTIDVDSKSGEYTEFSLTLLPKPPAASPVLDEEPDGGEPVAATAPA